MPRLMLSDEQWSKLKTIMLQEGIYDKLNLRLEVEGMFYRMRVGCPWRDLPKQFGKWASLYKKFNDWSMTGKWLRIFKAVVQDPDLEWVFMDGSYVKAHQHSAGAAGKDCEAIGISRAGRTSKIHLAVDSYGLPISFKITGGQVHDCLAAPSLIESFPPPEVLTADKGYDSKAIRQQISEKGTVPNIPRKKNSVIGNASLDRHLYKLRHLVENAFARLKHFRAIATRFDKLKRNYQSMLAMACSYLWLPM
ncbi:IS5 family transposase [unidentified bacterial endosymbiont]|uniref:IS5 family transposase n=1 Tax=unidentified bacterial endosymbiont TaxID=2355 RepID=UPI0020A08679|nr:IS5 family transposase [unidentified bacterial endosymbiont]